MDNAYNNFYKWKAFQQCSEEEDLQAQQEVLERVRKQCKMIKDIETVYLATSIHTEQLPKHRNEPANINIMLTGKRSRSKQNNLGKPSKNIGKPCIKIQLFTDVKAVSPTGKKQYFVRQKKKTVELISEQVIDYLVNLYKLIIIQNSCYNFKMQLAQTQIEITQEEVEVRDIAELYLRIQQNTEYLTNIVRHQHGRVFKLFTLDTPNIEIKSFFNLIVQSSYLLYTCYVRKVVVYLSKHLYINYQKQGPEVILEFLHQKEFLRFDETKRKQILSTFNLVHPFKYENAYAECVLNSIKYYLQIIKQYMKKQKQKKIMSDRNISRQLETLENAFGLLYSISQKGIKPKTLISCLQETEVFRTYSYLLKTLISSLYQAIRKSGKFEAIVHEIKRKQFVFNEGFNMMIRENKVQPETLESCMEDFIHFLIQKNLVQMQVSVKSKSNSLQTIKQKQLKVGQAYTFKNGKHQDRVYVWKVLIEQKKMKELNQKILQEGPTQGQTTTNASTDQKKTQNLFHIEYMAKRNLINVIYVSNIEVNIENSDAILFHCSNMSLELSNVIVEHIQKQTVKSKRKQRVIGFKVVQHLNPKQNPFINIMLMIDRAMIIGKVCQPQIYKKVTKIEDTSKFSIVGKRINHLSNLFIKKVRKLYESIGLK